MCFRMPYAIMHMIVAVSAVLSEQIFLCRKKLLDLEEDFS